MSLGFRICQNTPVLRTVYIHNFGFRMVQPVAQIKNQKDRMVILLDEKILKKWLALGLKFEKKNFVFNNSSLFLAKL